ncbi:MAG: hypothetical protein QGG39_18735, partial [Candidatus Poribacteria bacterium]|nr:hypothetical protein [Candidatus Poribacteria bacterium]
MPTTVLTDVSTAVDLKLKFTEAMDLDSLKDSQVQLDLLPTTDGGNDGDTVASFRIRQLDGGNHVSLLASVTALEEGGTLLHIQSQKYDSGQAKVRLLEDRSYRVTFGIATSNPRDLDDNPLNLAGSNLLAFDFSTAMDPKIDFYASTIGNKRIRSTDDANRYLLPTAFLTDVSTVVDLKLRFTEPMNLDSLK